MKALLCLALLAGCYNYDAPACSVACVTSADCPGSQACTVAGRCAASASTVCGTDQDAAIDALPDTAEPMLRVTVFDDRGLPTLARVIAATPAGVPVADVMTNAANGVATFKATVTVDVTVIPENIISIETSLTTILAAQPGDDLVFGPRRNETPTVMRTITWPPFAEADNYSIYATCGGGAQINIGTVTSRQVTLEAGCSTDFDVMVIYFDLQLNSYGYQLKTGATGDVIFPTNVWTAFSPESGSFTLLPSVVPNGNMAFTGAGVFRAGQPALAAGAIGTTLIGSPTAVSNITMPTQNIVQRELALRLFHNADGNAQQMIAQRVPPSGTWNLAVESALVPFVMAPLVASLEMRSITWERGSAGSLAKATPDLIAAELGYMRGGSRFRWRVIAPPSRLAMMGGGGAPEQLRLTFPELPGDETVEPRATDVFQSTRPSLLRQYAFLTPMSTVPSYTMLRAKAARAITLANGPLTVTEQFLVDGDLARMVVSQYGPF